MSNTPANSENKLYRKVNCFINDNIEMVKDKKELKQEKLRNAIKKYKEKIPILKSEDTFTEKLSQQKFENLKENISNYKKGEMYQNFKDFCIIKKNNTLININLIKESVKDNKDKFKKIRQEYSTLKKEKKDLTKNVKISILSSFVLSNTAYFYLSYIKKIFKFRFFRFLGISCFLSLSLNYIIQSKLNDYLKIKRKETIQKIILEK